MNDYSTCIDLIETYLRMRQRLADGVRLAPDEYAKFRVIVDFFSPKRVIGARLIRRPQQMPIAREAWIGSAGRMFAARVESIGILQAHVSAGVRFSPGRHVDLAIRSDIPETGWSLFRARVVRHRESATVVDLELSLGRWEPEEKAAEA